MGSDITENVSKISVLRAMPSVVSTFGGGRVGLPGNRPSSRRVASRWASGGGFRTPHGKNAGFGSPWKRLEPTPFTALSDIMAMPNFGERVP